MYARKLGKLGNLVSSPAFERSTLSSSSSTADKDAASKMGGLSAIRELGSLR